MRAALRSASSCVTMDELTAWCTARGFTAKMTAVVVDAYVDLETLRACVDPADAMDEALAEVGLAIGPRKVVLKAVRTLLEPAPPVAAPPPVQFAAPQPANVAAPQPVRAPAPVSPEPDPKPVQASTPPEPRLSVGARARLRERERAAAEAVAVVETASDPPTPERPEGELAALRALDARRLSPAALDASMELLPDLLRRCAIERARRAAAEDAGTECVVCLEDARSVAFGCGHLCVCEACAPTVVACPLCREPVRAKQRIYFD